LKKNRLTEIRTETEKQAVCSTDIAPHRILPVFKKMLRRKSGTGIRPFQISGIRLCYWPDIRPAQRQYRIQCIPIQNLELIFNSMVLSGYQGYCRFENGFAENDN
jgi:hypothetical protein